MSRRSDLEQYIRESYSLVREYEEIVRLSADPKERERARRQMEEQWQLIGEWLAEFNVPGTSELLQGPYIAWTPDSKCVVTPVPEGESGQWSLYMFSVETGEKRKLMNLPAEMKQGNETAPAFSPDGRVLAFARVIQTVSYLYLLHLGEGYGPQGAPQRVPSEDPVTVGVAWTPDGNHIVFSSGRWGSSARSSNPRLWRVVASAPGKPRRLSFAQESARAPSISLLGNRLAYSVDTGDTNIWRVDLPGPERKPGVPFRFISSTRADSQPAFSPDGKSIAFGSDRSGTQEIWLCESDGLNPVQLTSFGSSGEFSSGWKWSPDGRSIAFYRSVGENLEVYVVSANGGVPRRLTTDPAQDNWPCWSRDGQSIYFRSNRGGTSQIWRLPASGGNAVQISRDPDGADQPHESPDGRSVYYSKGYPDPQSVWRVSVGGGEATKVLDGVHPTALWTVAENGIHFFTKPDERGYSDLSVYEFPTSKTRRILTVERPVTWTIEASRDGRTILYTQIDEAGSDLMLVENFR
jgi:Tol biopolymer transport system component